MQDRPRFRTDLVAQPVMDAGQRFVDVTDPDSGSTFRFYEVEYAVACAMDGARDYSGLAAWSQAELGLEPSKEEIETVVSTLQDLGYLAPAGSGVDVELGHAGKSSLSEPRPVVSAPDVELGHAGSTVDEAPAAAAAAPEAQAEPDTGGAPVSVDLSQHLSIDKDDVKEAVRQSRVMSAVEDELDEFDDHDAQTTVGGPALQTKKDEPDPGSEPIEIPPEAPKAARPAPALPTAPASEGAEESSGGAMTFVLVILLIGVVAAGGWFVYTNFFQKQDDASSQTTHEPAPVAKQQPAKKKSQQS